MKIQLTALTFLLSALPLFAGVVAEICHRGDHTKYPENTMAAFQAAIDHGADFIEMDVRTTADGHLILLHDATVDRTTNGSGELKTMNFSDVEALDAGIKLGPQFAGTRIPAFEQAFQLASGKIGIYVDHEERQCA